jgi:O-antigen/teichoic acid export membrane protein
VNKVLLNDGKLTSAIGWSALELFVRHGLSFVVSIILARILVPADFGLLAMLSVFVAMANLLIDSGFSQALIQRQTSSHTDESTIFFFNLIMGALVALGLCLAAPWIARFYQQPLLDDVTRVMAFNVFLGGCASIHTALLTKELNFKVQAQAGVLATLVAGGLAIYMAASGWGGWSLVAQAVASSLISVAMLWLLHPWRPRRVFSGASLRSHFRFGGFLLLTGVLSNLYVNLSSLLIGKLYSAADVGFYTRGQNLQQVPVGLMTSMVGRIAFPVFSKTADDKARLAAGMRKAQAAVMLINAPAMIGLFVLAEPVVLTLLGPKWAAAVPVLQVLSVGGLLWPLNALNLNVLKAQGHSDLNVRILLVKLTVGLGLLLAASSHGIVVIAWSQAVSAAFAFFVNAYYTRRFLNYGPWAQLRDLFPCFVAGAISGLGMWLVLRFADFPYGVELVLAGGAGALLYLAACHLLRVEALGEARRLMGRQDRLVRGEV